MGGNPIPAQRAIVEFGPFRVERDRGVLVRGDEIVPLRPKAWQTLLLLIDRPDELLSIESILEDVWPGVTVTPKTLANVIGELRQALGDDAEKPRYIGTVHRRGYRFLGTATPPTSYQAPDPADALVGRVDELRTLQSCWDRASREKRHVVFVVGEPGIGKTRLVREFVQRLAPAHPTGRASQRPPKMFASSGQCVERHGNHEAFMPILDAIAGLAETDARPLVVDSLRRYAPTWLAQLPWLAPPIPDSALTPTYGEARMLREGVQFFDALSQHAPVLLILEDLHWADIQTVELVAGLVRRPQPARTMILCTYRPVEARLHRHPIAKVADDARRIGATAIELENFSAAEIHSYLDQRFPDSDVAAELTTIVEQSSGGNPLFVRAVTDHMLASGRLVFESGKWSVHRADGTEDLSLPDSVRGVIQARVERLPDDAREILEAAAVVGPSFQLDMIAAVLATPEDIVEPVLQELVRQSQIITPATGPRSHIAVQTRSPEFAFDHALYQRVLYDRIPLGIRRTLHQRAGEFLEQRPEGEVSPASIAVHFERSQDCLRAAHHLERCAIGAARRQANHERRAYLERALAQINRLPAGKDRAARELRTRIGLAEATGVLAGPQHEAVEFNVARALSLCREVDDPRSLFLAIHGIWLYSVFQGTYTSETLINQARNLADGHARIELVLLARMLLGISACFRGDPRHGHEQLEAAAQLLAEVDMDWIPVTIPDIWVEIHSTLAWSLWLVGFPDRALRHAQDALNRAVDRRDLPSATLASIFLYNVSHLRGEFDRARLIARELQLMGTEFDVEFIAQTGVLLEAGILVEDMQVDAAFMLLAQSRIAEGDPGLQQIVRTYFVNRLALACGRMGNPYGGLLLLNEAFVRIERSGSPVSIAETWRVRGELALQVDEDIIASLDLAQDESTNPMAYAESCFTRAIAVARVQGARSLELRATVSLARLWQQRGLTEQARQWLRPLFETFTEGLESSDLREAAVLLRELQGERPDNEE